MVGVLRCIYVVLLCTASLVSHAQTCAPDRVDERVRVSRVHDGDTVQLRDGRKLRFVGVDTPELGRDGAPSQPYAQEAARALDKLLAAQPFLQLRYDAERRDPYQRLLAHLYLENGVSVEAWLLEQGYATQLVVPPNVWNLECYRAAERRAREARRGIWSLPRYQPVEAAALPRDAAGFYVVRGRVARIAESAKSVWLNLPGDVALRIDRKDLRYFDAPAMRHWEGRTLIARGWLHRERGGLVMRVRHPAALDHVENAR